MKRLPLITAALLALLAASAQASYDPIATGTATLALDKSFTKLLKQNGIKLTGRKEARVRGSVATLPAAGGKADPTIKKAEIEAGGELVFRGAGGSAALTHIEFLTKPTPLIAKLGGGQLKVAKAAKVTLAREGFGNRLSATALKLTAKTATRLNKRLRTEAFAEGQKLGSLRSATQPAAVAVLPTGLATIEFDPTIYAKLKADSTSLNPIFPAEHSGSTFTFPIATEGLIAPDGRTGTLRLAGSLEFLRLGAGQVFWNEPWLQIQSLAEPKLPAPVLSAEADLEPPPKFPGKLGRTPVLDPALSAPTAYTYSDPTARTVTISGAPLTLNAATATYFNQAFAEGKPEFSAGELLGTLSFTAQTQ